MVTSGVDKIAVCAAGKVDAVDVGGVGSLWWVWMVLFVVDAVGGYFLDEIVMR
ncbi:hypothetical protein ACGE24_06300 [Corynebacterium kroppenstedtii]|uniref:hypothetical protein n=1 Tax=Corynebacterium sp. PCR 32 TaxID=3351342 RepID=UPI0030AE5EBA